MDAYVFLAASNLEDAMEALGGLVEGGVLRVALPIQDNADYDIYVALVGDHPQDVAEAVDTMTSLSGVAATPPPMVLIATYPPTSTPTTPTWGAVLNRIGLALLSYDLGVSPMEVYDDADGVDGVIGRAIVSLGAGIAATGVLAEVTADTAGEISTMFGGLDDLDGVTVNFSGWGHYSSGYGFTHQ